MNPCLPTFINKLAELNLIEFDVLGRNAEHFDNRFKIQKYVFLAKLFGLDMDYDFGLYLHGPYSKDLASEYYDLGKYGADNTVDLPPEFDVDGFFNLVNGKDLKWLETAATLISLTSYFRERNSLIEKTANMKEHISKTEIESALEELEAKALITS